MPMQVHRGPCWAAMLCLWLGVLGCDDPGRPLEPVPADGSMMLLAVLDPDTTVQPILIESIEPERGWSRLRVDLYLDDVHATSRPVPDETPSGELNPCISHYAATFGFVPRCPTLEVAPPAGSHYRLVVSADGRPTATAEGRIPSDFRITSVSTRGDPPGTEGLEVHWTPSDGAWRYVVGVRTDSGLECISMSECIGDWLAVTSDTVIHTTVPAEGVKGIQGPWYVDVYAMERGLYEFITTGAAGDLFPIPPVQNVEGGYGAVGAWVWRSAAIEP